MSVSSRPEAFLPFQETKIQRPSTVLVANPEIEEFFVLVTIMDQPVEQVIKRADLSARVGGGDILRMGYEGSLVNGDAGKDIEAMIHRKLLDLLRESAGQL